MHPHRPARPLVPGPGPRAPRSGPSPGPRSHGAPVPGPGPSGLPALTPPPVPGSWFPRPPGPDPGSKGSSEQIPMNGLPVAFVTATNQVPVVLPKSRTANNAQHCWLPVAVNESVGNLHARLPPSAISVSPA